MEDVLNQSAPPPTPAEYLVQKACHWRTVERALIASKTDADKSAHHKARMDLRKAVDLYVASGAQP